MNRFIAVEANVGETRTVLVEDGRVVELSLERWSEADSRAHAASAYMGRVRRVDGSLNASFVDLGFGPDGFLPFGKAGRPKGMHEGAAWPVKVTREAFGEKGPTLKIIEADLAEDAPCLLDAAPSIAEQLAARYPDVRVLWADETEIDIAEALDEALSRQVDIPGGGHLVIEPTAALTAIDVDAGTRTAAGGAEKLAGDLNRSAAKESARQIRLRGLGGVIAIDFVHMRDRKQRSEIEQIMRRAFKRDAARVDVAPMSPFGIVELARQRTGRTLAEIMLGADGHLTIESCALNALRQLELEGRAVRGRQPVLRVSGLVAQWLTDHDDLWRSAMNERLGPRFTVESVDDFSDDKFDIAMQ